MPKAKILMVCLGNICRSPLAEGILQSKLGTSFFVDSAGTASYHVGSPPDSRSIEVAEKYGIDITSQRARVFTRKDFDEFDYIYAMDTSNFKDILHLAKTNHHKNKVRLVLDSVDNNKRDVPDPYYGENNGFEKVYSLLEHACEAIKEELKKS